MPTTTTATPNGSAQTSDSEFSNEDESSVTARLESNRVLQKLRDKTDAVVESIQPRIAAVSTYARSEPTKAVLIAAASGAALMALIALLARPGRPSSPGARTMAAIRDAAIDLADRAHSVATDAIGAAHQRANAAQERVGELQKRATAAQQRAADIAGDVQQRAADAQKRAGEMVDGVADTWQSLRDQAAPVVERFRPQIDAVTSYAKEDPTRAVLGVATAGAVLVGLLALIRRSGD